MKQDFELTDICEICGEEFGDHSAHSFSCPNKNRYAPSQAFYTTTVFTKQRVNHLDHIEHSNC